MSEARDDTTREGLTILVLDDEPMILVDLQFTLEDAGLTPVTAPTAEMALERIARARPDAAVLDVNLGGGETCEAVAARLEDMGVPFILYTGDLDRRGEVVASFDAPILPKPTPAHRVVEALLKMTREG